LAPRSIGWRGTNLSCIVAFCGHNNKHSGTATEPAIKAVEMTKKMEPESPKETNVGTPAQIHGALGSATVCYDKLIVIKTLKNYKDAGM